MRPAGFEPAIISLGGDGRGKINLREFKKWLKNQKLSDGWISEIIRLVGKYGDCLFDLRKAAELKGLDRSSQANVLKALSHLSRFLGRRDLFERMKSEVGLKWGKKSSVDAAIRILTTDYMQEGLSYLDVVSRSRLKPEYKHFIFLAAETGLRKKELFLLIKYWKKAPQSKDGFLELFRTKELREVFLRKTKNVYVVYCDDHIKQHLEVTRNVTYGALRSAGIRAGIDIKLQLMRDMFANMLVWNGLIREAVNVIQGRVEPEVFMQFYFSSQRQTMIQVIRKVLEEIRRHEKI